MVFGQAACLALSCQLWGLSCPITGDHIDLMSSSSTLCLPVLWRQG